MELIESNEGCGITYEIQRKRIPIWSVPGSVLVLIFATFAMAFLYFLFRAIVFGEGRVATLILAVEIPCFFLLGTYLHPPLRGVLGVNSSGIRLSAPDGSVISGLWSDLVEVVPREKRPWTLHFAVGAIVPLQFENKNLEFIEKIAICSGDDSLLSLAWRDEEEMARPNLRRELLSFFWLFLLLFTSSFSGAYTIYWFYGIPPLFDLEVPAWFHLAIAGSVWVLFFRNLRRTTAWASHLRYQRKKAGRYRRS